MVEKKIKKYKVVIGSLFGDEGKGRTVNWLVKKERGDNKKVVVIRYSGGPQAGHTVNEANNTTHIFSTYGSGSLNGADTYLDCMFMFDPISFTIERDKLLEDLSRLDISDEPKVWINRRCRIITPYDVLAGRKDANIMSHGTCGKGIYTTFNRYNERFGISIKFSMHKNINDVEYILNNPIEYLQRVKAFYEDLVRSLIEDDISLYDEMFCNACSKIKNLIKEDKFKIREEDFRRSGLYDTIIYEGSQGLLLDMDRGFMPHCTPSKVGLNGIPGYVTSDTNTEVYLVTRCYLTRHGNGYDPYEEDSKLISVDNLYMKSYYDNLLNMIKDSFDDVLMKETNVYNDFQKEFKYGMFNLSLLNRSFDRHCLDNYPVKYNLVVTHTDIMENMLKEYKGFDRCFPFINEKNNIEYVYIVDDFFRYLKNNIQLNIDKIYNASNISISNIKY